MKMKKSLISIIPILLILCLPTPTISQKCNNNDKRVLLQIKNSLRNPSILSSWQNGVDCCYWHGIKCNKKTGRVTELSIISGNFVGRMPPQVGYLPFLQKLEIRKFPGLSGNIPSTIARLTRLSILTLSWNDLTGRVPSFISQLKNLQYIDLSFNSLTGPIPPVLSTLPKLIQLDLARNKLTGGVPKQFGRFNKNFKNLYLSHNVLTGNIPKSLGFRNYAIVDFSRNQLTGDISMFFGAHKTIREAYFQMNKFRFDLSKLVFPAGIQWLDLNHNQIYGRVPASLRVRSLQHLDVSNNALCGKIPLGGHLQSFGSGAYVNNRCLCGSPLQACR